MDGIAQASAVDRADLFQRAAKSGKLVRSSEIMEKDFWVCWTLHRLFDVMRFKPHLIFKGGTSLSKAYNAIERFSEDVDLSISRRDLGFTEDLDPEQAGISKREAKRRLDKLVDECRIVIRDRFLPEMRIDFASVIGNAGWRLDLEPQDSQTVTSAYPTSTMEYGLGVYINPVIRLEMGVGARVNCGKNFQLKCGRSGAVFGAGSRCLARFSATCRTARPTHSADSSSC